MKKMSRRIMAYVLAFTMSVTFMQTYRVDGESITVTEDMILKSPDISVDGYQIKENYSKIGEPDLAFRIIAKAPKVGSVITVDGKEYTVAEMGTIYVLDPDCSGEKANRKLSKAYTILDEESLTVDGEVKYYRGANEYEGQNRTFGFVATEKGFNNNYNPDDTENSYYIRTMTGMNEIMANSIQVRPFVIATDGTIIYSELAWTLSVAYIAYQVYCGRDMPTEQGHKYLYDNILNSELLAKIYAENNAYKFYMTKPIDYVWSDLVTPGE